MATNIIAFIQFDDNSPRGEAPFTNAPSLWSLEWDIGLWGCKDYNFMGAVSGVRNQRNKEPLIPLRGCPPGNERQFENLKDEPFVGFLSHEEVLRCLGHHDLSVDKLHPSVQNVLKVLALLSDRYGDDRVRLVFQMAP